MDKETECYPLSDSGVYHKELINRIDETNRILMFLADSLGEIVERLGDISLTMMDTD